LRSVSAKSNGALVTVLEDWCPGYPQRLRIKRQDVSGHTVSRLSGTLSRWEKTLAGIDPNDSEKVKAVTKTSRTTNGSWRTFQELARK